MDKSILHKQEIANLTIEFKFIEKRENIIREMQQKLRKKEQEILNGKSTDVFFYLFIVALILFTLALLGCVGLAIYTDRVKNLNASISIQLQTIKTELLNLKQSNKLTNEQKQNSKTTLNEYKDEPSVSSLNQGLNSEDYALSNTVKKMKKVQLSELPGHENLLTHFDD